MNATHAQRSADCAVVCCIESGPLEDQTLRMVRSLRRWGGRLANAPLLAVTSRFGPPLCRETRRGLDALDVRMLRLRPGPELAPWTWNKFLNKPAALLEAARTLPQTTLVWLDSDILVAGEPEELLLRDDEDFAACAPDKNVGSTGPGDPGDAYWAALCAALDLDLAALPFVTTLTEHARIRLYFNSGVFAFRRESGFARAFLHACLRLLEARVASKAAGIFFLDQVALGLVAHKLGLRWRELPLSCNHTLGSRVEPMPPEELARAAILHYHDSLWPVHWPRLLRTVGAARPDVAEWLAGQGPMRNPAPPAWKALARLLAMRRTRLETAHTAACTAY